MVLDLGSWLALFVGVLDFAVTPDGRWAFFGCTRTRNWLAVEADAPTVDAIPDACKERTASSCLTGLMPPASSQ
jgi:hypothetical protein